MIRSSPPLQRLGTTAFILLGLGLLLRALLPEPLLIWMGLDYAGVTGGQLWAKIHISSLLIVMSFTLMLMHHGNPIRVLNSAARHYSHAFSLFMITALITLFWVVRDTSGVGLMLDTHLPVPLAILILTQATQQQRTCVIALLFGFGLLNAGLGIIEGFTQIRFMPYPDDWGVAQDYYFRASAFLGHPLNNALYSAVLLLSAQTIIRNAVCRHLVTFILLAALVAFGGRAAMVVTCIMYVIGMLRPANTALPPVSLPTYTSIHTPILRFIPPLALAAFLAILLVSPLGQRLMAFADGHDASAQSRLTALHVFDYVEKADLWLGMSVARLDEVRQQLTDHYAMSDIENPWLLMLLLLGAVLFPLWLLAFARLVHWLWRLSPFHTRLALLTYLLVVSTSNGFGRKDGILLLALTLITAITLEQRDRQQRQSKTTPHQPWPAPWASQ